MWQPHLPLLARSKTLEHTSSLFLRMCFRKVQQSPAIAQSRGASCSASVMIPTLASELDELVHRPCRRVIRAESHCKLKELAVSTPCHHGAGCGEAAQV
jgi:hypothetical protein